MTRDRELTRSEKLAARRCVPCERGGPPLSEEAIAGLLWHLDGWECQRRHHLAKTFEFDDFVQGLAFVNRCGELAEREGHHPDLFLKWGLVRVEVYTHTIDGLTESDFILAAKIDRIVV
jgi:4a-hydroxytetrahydrobiopterin dehydratase